uniref:Large ribosomal subunit protein uL10m n=1 Tax=Ciona savignyi TaxID=51511 RepID=H2Z2B4_CIOSA
MLMQITLPRLQAAPDRTRFVEEETEEKLYGLDVLLHRELQTIFNESEMVVACLYTEMPSDYFYEVRYELQQHEMNMEKYPEHIYDFTLKGTPFENMLELFRGETTVVFGKANLKEMLLALGKNKHLLPLGGLVQGRCMSMQELIKFSKLDIDQCRSELSQLLTTAVGSTRTLLQGPSLHLSNSLSQRHEQLSTSLET